MARIAVFDVTVIHRFAVQCPLLLPIPTRNPRMGDQRLGGEPSYPAVNGAL